MGTQSASATSPGDIRALNQQSDKTPPANPDRTLDNAGGFTLLYQRDGQTYVRRGKLDHPEYLSEPIAISAGATSRFVTTDQALVGFTGGAAPFLLSAKMSALAAGALAVSPVAAGEIVRIAAGREGPFTDTAGHLWQADTGFAGGVTANAPAVIDSGTNDPELYRGEHWGMTSFGLPMPNGKYVVKLHFAENAVDGPGKRVFSFNVQGHAFKDFDIAAKAGAVRKAYIETVPNVVVADGQLTISFTPKVLDPSIHALEIIPENLAAPPIIRIAAGRNQPFTDAAGHVWQADTGFTNGTMLTIPSATDSNTNDPELYLAQRSE